MCMCSLCRVFVAGESVADTTGMANKVPPPLSTICIFTVTLAFILLYNEMVQPLTEKCVIDEKTTIT